MAITDIHMVRLYDAAGNVLSTIPVSLAGVATETTLAAINAKTVVDSTDRQRVSIYGKASVAGDTPWLMSSGGIGLVAGAAQTGSGDAIALSTITSMYTTSSVVTRPLATLNYLHNGTSLDMRRTPLKFVDVSAVAIGTIASLWTPTTGKKFRLMGGCISVSAAANVLFEDNAAAAFVWRLPKLLADTPFAFTLGGNGFLSAAANNILKATSSAAANITGTLYGTEE